MRRPPATISESSISYQKKVYQEAGYLKEKGSISDEARYRAVYISLDKDYKVH